MFVELIKKHIESLKEKKRKKEQQEAEIIRKYTINKIDHTWSRREWSDYNYWSTSGEECNYVTSAQYQKNILEHYKKYLSDEEYQKYNKDIIDRRTEEVRRELGLKRDSISVQSPILEKKL